METEKFDLWCLVELFGHSKICGRCTEQSIAGSNFLRVDVPETKHKPGFTRFLNHAAIYAINPITEEMGRFMAEQIQARPIESWDVAKFNQKQKELQTPEGFEKREKDFSDFDDDPF